MPMRYRKYRPRRAAKRGVRRRQPLSTLCDASEIKPIWLKARGCKVSPTVPSRAAGNAIIVCGKYSCRLMS